MRSSLLDRLRRRYGTPRMCPACGSTYYRLGASGRHGCDAY